MHWDIAGYTPSDIRVSAAFDIDARKVGKDVHEAIFAEPNCTTVFQAELPPSGVKVQMGPIMAGYADHMAEHPQHLSFQPASIPPLIKEEIIQEPRDDATDVMASYVPVGSGEDRAMFAHRGL